MGMSEISWVECVDCKEKRAEVAALETTEKTEPFGPQLAVVLCQTLWSFTLCLCVLVHSRGQGDLCAFWSSFSLLPHSFQLSWPP